METVFNNLNNKNLASADELGIVCNGNKCSVAASIGQYVILRNSTISGCADGLYTAAKAIPANTAITSTYLTTVSDGGLNALNSKISKIHSGTKVSTFSSGGATHSFTDFGASARPTTLILTPSSHAVIMTYNWDESSSSVHIHAIDHTGTGFSGGLRYSWICIP